MDTPGAGVDGLTGVLLGQVDPAAEAEVRLVAACAEPGGTNAICVAVGRATTEELGLLAGRALPLLGEIALIVVLALVAERLAKRAIARFVAKVRADALARLAALQDRAPASQTGPIHLARADQRTATAGALLRNLCSIAIAVVAGALVLGAIGIELGPLLGAAGIAGVALGFGAQNLVKDWLAGLFVLVEDQYGIGDIVTLGNASSPIASGVVEGLTLRVTRLRDLQGTLWHIPNGEIRAAGNKSQLFARSLLDIGVALGTDIEGASAVIRRVADELWHDPGWAGQVLEEPELWGIEAFTPTSVVIRLVIKVEPARQWAVERELRARLLTAFAAEGIAVPRPELAAAVDAERVPRT